MTCCLCPKQSSADGTGFIANQPSAKGCDCFARLKECTLLTCSDTTVMNPDVSFACAMLPKSYLSGAGWQLLANQAKTTALSTNPGINAPFGCLSGFGEGLGVFAGNFLSWMAKLSCIKCCPGSNISLYCMSDTEKSILQKKLDQDGQLKAYFCDALGDSAFYAFAGWGSGAAWQLVVNWAGHLFNVTNASLLANASLVAKLGVTAITGLASGLIFLSISVALRYFKLTQTTFRIRGLSGKTFANDLTASMWNVFCSAAAFVFTLYIPAFMGAGLIGVLLAGLSTFTGYMVSQVVEVPVKAVLAYIGAWDAKEGWKKFCCTCPSCCRVLPCLADDYFKGCYGGYITI